VAVTDGEVPRQCIWGTKQTSSGWEISLAN